MKTMLRGALAALLMMLVAGAAQAEDAHPALWKVQRGDATIYLFGTTHALKPEVTWFDGPVKAAFDQSQELVLEVLEPDPARMAAIVGTATTSDTRPLIDRLPEKERPAYAQRLASFGLPPAAFDRFDPWFAMVNFGGLALRKAGYDTNLSCEHILVAAARNSGKALVGLETPEQQFGYFKSAPLPLQLESLVRLLDREDRTAEVVDNIARLWRGGDPEGVAAAMNAEFTSPAFAKTIVTDRNARWALWIAARLARPGIAFVAVGAGHLGGKESVQAILARDGIKAERVYRSVP
ncbi:MAG: TraB/GumN family protein [Sphingomonas bacterium]